MTSGKRFMCSMAVALICTWGEATVYARRGPQRPVDQANPGSTTQGHAGTTGPGQTAKTAPDAPVGNSADRTFVRKAAAEDLAEVKMGQLAQQKASNPEVKRFSMRMVSDHAKANRQLQEVATKDNVAVPTGLDAQDQATYDKLSKLSGPQFDREYMNDMVTDSENDVSEFKREASAGKNPEVKKFASETLPTLQERLKMARDISQKASAEADATNTYGRSAQ